MAETLQTAKCYVAQTPEGGWRVAGTRVLLECLINAYHEGLSAEEIAFQYPTLTLEQIHGAIAFYLGNREEMDEYMKKLDEKWEQFRREAADRNAELRRRIQVVRQAENRL